MDINIGDIIIWILVGGFAGSVVGAIVKGKKTGYGRWKNMSIGLAGAAIGGILSISALSQDAIERPTSTTGTHFKARIDSSPWLP